MPETRPRDALDVAAGHCRQPHARASQLGYSEPGSAELTSTVAAELNAKGTGKRDDCAEDGKQRIPHVSARYSPRSTICATYWAAHSGALRLVAAAETQGRRN
jgi:hypothetical protein